MADIWTVLRVYPERGRVRLLDTLDREAAEQRYGREVVNASDMGYGVVQLLRCGRVVTEWTWNPGKPSVIRP